MKDGERSIDERLREVLGDCPMLTEADVDVFVHQLVLFCAGRMIGELLPGKSEEEIKAELMKLADMSETEYGKEIGRDKKDISDN